MHNVADIVLVDDDELYREALSADLADRGFAVSCFPDGPSFLRAVSNGTAAQVALLDWALPEMSGSKCWPRCDGAGSGCRSFS